MKKLILSGFLLFILSFGNARENKLIIPSYFETNMSGTVKAGKPVEDATKEKIEYKIVLSEIFKEEEFERVKLRLKQDNAPFEIIEVDYKAKTLHIKLQNKIPYDQLEKVFGNMRLNIVKIEALT